MGDSVEKDLDVTTSGAVDDCLSHGDELLIAFTSTSPPTENRSPGPVNETSLEQLGTAKLDADKAMDMIHANEDSEEKPNLIETTEPENSEELDMAHKNEDSDKMPKLIETTEPENSEELNMAHKNEDSEEMPKLIETTEPEKPKKSSKFNLRKSLAWDSAFFTSDGVLDADELSNMIERGEKGKKNQLPGIEEEVYRSMESISTLESDNLTLECIEAELFEDIRASIQKSNTTSNLKNNNNSSIKVPSGKKDSQGKVNSSLKKVDLDSGNGKRPASRIKDHNNNHTSSIPKPKIISKVNPTSTLTKRASLSTNQAKKDQDIGKQSHVAHKGNQAVKPTTGVINPRRGVPKPLPTSKSSSLSSSSCSNSSSSSGNDLRKKVDSRNGINKVTAGQIPKTPSRMVNTKNKVPPVKSRLSSNLMVSSLSSSVSPASSIDLSSETSSTTSINRRSVESIDSCLSVHNHPTGLNKNENGNQQITGSVSRPPSFQPTGLRMPSPKIGFFDGGKSGARTPNGGVRSQIRAPTTSNIAKIPPPKAGLLKPNPQKSVPKQSQEQQITKPKISLEAFENVGVDKLVIDHSRTPFAVRNVCKSGLEVTEKIVDFSFVEGQHKENSEII